MIEQSTIGSVSAVELRNVSKSYPGNPPVHALSDVSISVTPGSFLGIVGASGSGKSTLLHVVGTLSRPSSGRVFINGLDTAGMSDTQLSGIRSSSVGFIFQDFFLLPGFSATENVENGLLYSGVSPIERTGRAKAMLERVGLAHRMNHLANEMSGGEQQRVAIARAMVNEPSFLLADEPTGNVDSQNSSSLMDLFLELNLEGTTIILITHDMGIASLASRQIVLKDGFVESDSSQN